LTQWFREMRAQAGISTGSLHTLRHTAATIALTSGIPVHIVAARLGDDPTRRRPEDHPREVSAPATASDEQAARAVAAALTR
jgi:integrase